MSANHFLETDKKKRFYFEKGEIQISVYATVANRKKATLLRKIGLKLSEEQATQMHVRNSALVFTFDPQKKEYVSSLVEQGPSVN